jgi:hypothetical protein
MCWAMEFLLLHVWHQLVGLRGRIRHKGSRSAQLSTIRKQEAFSVHSDCEPDVNVLSAHKICKVLFSSKPLKYDMLF